MELMETKQIEATKANVELAINNIKKYAQEKEYRIIGEFKEAGFFEKLIGSSKLKFDSKSQEKVCKSYLWRLEQKVGMQNSNRFLHFLYKAVYKLDKAPYVEYSEKEVKIKEAKKAWKKVQAEADTLQALYKTEKGSFYGKKLPTVE